MTSWPPVAPLLLMATPLAPEYLSWPTSGNPDLHEPIFLKLRTTFLLILIFILFLNQVEDF